jgi:tripartite-type tricarboxylate transporter receptor subunit TctC
MLMMNRYVRLVLALAILMPLCAHAQGWPTRLIKAVVPYGAGSAADVVPRLVFDRLGAELGQPIVIENRPGAGGTLGSAMVAKAEPDGYSILAQSSALTVAPALYPNSGFDVSRDLVPIFMIGSTANVMIVPLSRPWNTIQDFLNEAKAKPGSISFGSVGIGSAVHISSEKFRLAADFQATHVPYRGGSEVITDILGGRIDFYFCPLATALPLIREGQVRALLVSTPKRVRELPDVPTPVDIGFKNADSAIWFGVFMPAKTSAEIVNRFHQAGQKVLSDPATRGALEKLGIISAPMSTSEMNELVKHEISANFEIVKAAGLDK